MDERDIAKDRELCEKASPPPWTVEQRGCHELGYDIKGPESGMRGMFEREEDAAFCAVSRTALPYYISRTEHLERMVDAAIDEIARRAEEVDAFKDPCPNGGWGCAKLGDLRKSKNFNATDEEEHEFCRKCWSDYLEQLEGERDA